MLVFLVATVPLLCIALHGTAQSVPPNGPVLEPFRLGNYAEAVAVAERTVAATRAKASESHPDHIKALIELGHALMADGRPDEARQPMQRAVDLASASFAPDALLLADALDGLGTTYMLDGYSASGLFLREGTQKAAPLLKRALAIRETSIRGHEMAYVDLVERLASLLEASNGGAARLLIRSIAFARDQLGDNHLAVGVLLLKYEQLKGQSDYVKQRAARRASQEGADQLPLFMSERNSADPGMAIIRQTHVDGAVAGEVPLATYTLIAALSSIAGGDRRIFVREDDATAAAANAHAERVYLTLCDLRLGQVHASHARQFEHAWKTCKIGLFNVYEAQKRTSDLEAVAAQLEDYQSREEASSPLRTFLHERLNLRLAEYHEKRGDVSRAESFWKKEIAPLEAAGKDWEVANRLDGGLLVVWGEKLDGLAGFYERVGRNADADATMKRAIEIRSQVRGKDNGAVKELQRQLAAFQQRISGAPAPARNDDEPVKLPFSMMDAESGPDCRIDDPEFLAKVKAATTESDKLLSSCSWDDIGTIGGMLSDQQIDEARRQGKTLPGPMPAAASDEGAWDLSRQASEAKSAVESRDWKTAYKLLVQVEPRQFERRQAGETEEIATFGSILRPASASQMMIKAAWQVAQAEPMRRKEITQSTFLAAQRSQLLAAAAALSKTQARQASSSTRLALLLKERDALTAERGRLDAELQDSVLAVKRPAVTKVAADHDRIGQILDLIATIDQTLAKDFPDYVALTRPQPITVAQAQAHLKADEALVMVAAVPPLGDPPVPDSLIVKPKELQSEYAPSETWVWVVTQNAARWIKAEHKGDNIWEEILALRCGLDTAHWESASPTRERCEKMLRVPRPWQGYPPFHIYKAYSLYRALFSEVEDLIEGKRLLIAPSGPFASLPFQVLVTSEPSVKVPTKAAPTQLSAYQDISWLGTKHAITVLPAVGSLAVLRARAPAAPAARAFLGFGNPLLNGNALLVSHRDRAAQVPSGLKCKQVASLDKQLPLEAAPAPKMLLRGGLADVEMLRRQLPLPETADELCTIARKLGADDEDVVLGPGMTEANLKAMSAKGQLRGYRILHFATHGLIASETAQVSEGGAEPALLFTPPQTATPEDDGLLTASEVTQLDLEADWVIMSACRTAAGESENAEALSGLARAFFYAGARALLVSHWAVESEAAVVITTSAFDALAANPTIGKAEALRRAVVALQSKGGTNLHPAAWAPFSLVGGEAG